MLPYRPSGLPSVPPAARKSDPIPHPQAAGFENLKARVLAKLEDRLDPNASKRMPPSLLRQSLRQHAEQVTDQEARGLAKPDRDRLIDAVLVELLGYGPLEELFDDPTVREVMVTGPHTVIVRREQGNWLPASVRFRDEAHFRSAIDKLANNADPVGGVLASPNVFDLKLPNGFRAIGVVPPEALEQPPSVVFLRVETVALPPTPEPAQPSGRYPVPPATPATLLAGPSSGRYPAQPAVTPPAAVPPSGRYPASSATASASAATTRPVPGSPTASPRPGSNPHVTPEPRPTPSTEAGASQDPLLKQRNRIIERLISKLASLGVYDLTRLEVAEFRKVVAAYVTEYVAVEKIYLSDTDQGRLQLEILTTMQR